MPGEPSPQDPQSVARTLLEKGSMVATDTFEVLLTNVPDLIGKKHQKPQILFVPNAVLEEVGFPVPVNAPNRDTTRLGPLEAHFAGTDRSGVPHSSFDLKEVQRIAETAIETGAQGETATGGVERTVRADLQKSQAYLVNLTGEGFLLMPPPSDVVAKLLDDKGMSDARLQRRASKAGEATPVTHDSLGIEPHRVADLLREFPEITNLTGQGEISLQQLEHIEAERRELRGRQGVSGN